MGSVSSSVAKARRAVELRMSPTDAVTAAHNAANSSRLRKQMASDQQFGELQTTSQSMAGKGGRVQIRDAPRLANTYGGSTDDWSKIRSSNYKDVDGTSFETHAYRNESTGQVVEPKTKFQ